MKRIYNRQKAEFIPSPSQGENNIRKRGRGSEHEELLRTFSNLLSVHPVNLIKHMLYPKSQKALRTLKRKGPVPAPAFLLTLGSKVNEWTQIPQCLPEKALHGESGAYMEMMAKQWRNPRSPDSQATSLFSLSPNPLRSFPGQCAL